MYIPLCECISDFFFFLRKNKILKNYPQVWFLSPIDIIIPFSCSWFPNVTLWNQAPTLLCHEYNNFSGHLNDKLSTHIIMSGLVITTKLQRMASSLEGTLFIN